MSDLNSCVNIEELLDAFLDGELNSDERASVEQHLEICPKCTRQLKESERMIKELQNLPAKSSSREIDFSFLGGDAATQTVVSEECKTINQLLDAYHDGELADAEKKNVSEHVASCQTCSRALAQIEQLVFGLKSMPLAVPSRDIVEGLNFDQTPAKSNVLPFSRKFGIGIGAVAAAAVALIFAFNSAHAPGNSGANIAENNSQKTPVAQQPLGQQQNIASKNTELKLPEQPAANQESMQSETHENIAESLPEQNKTGAQNNSSLIASNAVDNLPTVKQEVLKLEPQKPVDTLNELATIPDSNAMIGADALGIGTDEDGLYDIKI